ncbi:MAG: type III pantothenate kinase [Bacteroidia bacterium]|nr:type III pantothenate kinase [Bacteroidia bacterium]
MILCIDIGNSRIKAGILDRTKVLFSGSYLKEGFPGGFILGAGKNYDPPALKYSALISVGKEAQSILDDWLYLIFKPENVMQITPETPLPFASAYKTPQTLGMDRVAGVAGARALAGNKPVLVIDAGTAVNIEYADGEGVYQGGSIGPGIRLRFKSLHDYTAKLPLLEADPDFSVVGQSTRECILSGVLNGFVCEIQGIISQYRELAGPDLQVFLTGGDAEFLGNHLKNINFVDPELVLKGVGAILQYNIHA